MSNQCVCGRTGHRARGYCDACYTRLRRAGAFASGGTLPSQPAEDPSSAPRLGADTISEQGNTRTVSKATAERVRTLEDLIRVCEIDTDVWEVIEWHANKWEFAAVPRAIGGNGKSWGRESAALIVTQMFQVKARLRRKIELISARQEVAELMELAKTHIVKPARHTPWAEIHHKKDASGNALEVDIFDLHLGKLAWAKETGYENYDLTIARRLFEEALETLIQRTASHTFDRCILPVGNDFFHTDNLIGETTQGTRQDCDGRFHKTAHIGREMMVHAIERLRLIAPHVDVVITPGNHDQLAAWHLGDSLECYFHRDSDVTIHNQPTLRKYIEFGNVLLMFTHGNRGKQLDYPLLMATEKPEAWGRTKYREAHIGHLHKTQMRDSLKVNEFHGARVRIISSLCAADAWHAEHTFVGNLRQAEAFVWNKDEGQIAHATYTAPESV